MVDTSRAGPTLGRRRRHTFGLVAWHAYLQEQLQLVSSGPEHDSEVPTAPGVTVAEYRSGVR